MARPCGRVDGSTQAAITIARGCRAALFGGDCSRCGGLEGLGYGQRAEGGRVRRAWQAARLSDVPAERRSWEAPQRVYIHL